MRLRLPAAALSLRNMPVVLLACDARDRRTLFRLTVMVVIKVEKPGGSPAESFPLCLNRNTVVVCLHFLFFI